MSEYLDKLQVTEKLKELAELNSACGYELTTLNLRLAANMIERITAADVVPVVHAHWKGYHTQDPYCSNCGFSYDREQGEDAQITDYCGNCGAKMDENEVENLKRCSCGDRHYRPEVEKDENGKWFIRCHMCHKIVWGNTIEEAVNAWNEGAKTDDETTP